MGSFVICSYLFRLLYRVCYTLPPPPSESHLIPSFNLYGYDQKTIHSTFYYYYYSKSLYNAATSLIVLVILHGKGSLVMLFVMMINYAIAKIAKGSRFLPLLTWIWNIVLLFGCDQFFKNFTFSYYIPALSFLVIHDRDIAFHSCLF